MQKCLYCYPEKLHNAGIELHESHFDRAKHNQSKKYSMQECKKTGSQEMMPAKTT